MCKLSLLRIVSRGFWLIAVLFLSFLTVGNADANLVTNGGFETALFSPGWTTVTDGVGSDIAVTWCGGACRLSTGSYAARFSSLGGLDYIYQTIPTIPGQAYLIDFWLTNGIPNFDAPDNKFVVNWDGTVDGQVNGLYTHNLDNLVAIPWTNMGAVVTATNTQTEIWFGGYNHGSQAYFWLDDVSVTETAVPEPSTLLLLGAGLAGVGLLRRRFKK